MFLRFRRFWPPLLVALFVFGAALPTAASADGILDFISKALHQVENVSGAAALKQAGLPTAEQFDDDRHFIDACLTKDDITACVEAYVGNTDVGNTLNVLGAYEKIGACLVKGASTSARNTCIDQFFQTDLGQTAESYGVMPAEVESCLDINNDVDFLQGCIQKILNDQAADGVTVAQYMSNIVSIYVDIRQKDYFQLVIDGGELVGCAVAEIVFTVDVCGAIRELVALAKDVYKVAKDVYEFFAAVGGEIAKGAKEVGCALGLGGCKSSPPPPSVDEQAYGTIYSGAEDQGLAARLKGGLVQHTQWNSLLFNLKSETLQKYPAVSSGPENRFISEVNTLWSNQIVQQVLVPSAANGQSGTGIEAAYKTFLKNNPVGTGAQAAVKRAVANFPTAASAHPGDSTFGGQVGDDSLATTQTSCLNSIWQQVPLADSFDWWLSDPASAEALANLTPPKSSRAECQDSYTTPVKTAIPAVLPAAVGCTSSAGQVLCPMAALPDCSSAVKAFGLSAQMQCTLDPAALIADIVAHGCAQGPGRFSCSSTENYDYCTADIKKYGPLKNQQCWIDPAVVANEAISKLDAVNHGSCQLSGNVITCVRDKKACACAELISDASGALSCKLDRPKDAGYNQEYVTVSGLLQGQPQTNAPTPLPQGVPPRTQWAREACDPLVVNVPSGLTVTTGAGTARTPSENSLILFQGTLNTLAAQLYPGHADACGSEPDIEQDGQERFQLCATSNSVNGETIGQKVLAMIRAQANTGSAALVYGTPAPTRDTAGQFGNAITDGGSFGEANRQATADVGKLQAQSSTHLATSQLSIAPAAVTAQTAVTGPTVAGEHQGAIATDGAAATGFNQQQSQTLNAKLPNNFGAPPPPPIGAGSNASVAIRVDGVRTQVTSGGVTSSRPSVVPAEGATVACPAELTIAAAALIPQAGAFTFESYLLAPDGSKQNWVHGIPLMAKAPLPYHAQTHGSYVLSGGSFNQTLTLVMNISMNGQNTHLEVPQHFSVTCQGARR